MDINLYTDGEQATAAVLNRPLNQIKGAVDTIENAGIIKETAYNRQWTGEKTAYQLAGYHKDYYYPVIFNFTTAYAQDPTDIWVGRAGVHGGHNSSWSSTHINWFCHESYSIKNLYDYGWGNANNLQLEIDKYEVRVNKNLLGTITQSSNLGTYGILWIRGGIYHYIQSVKNGPRAEQWIYNYDLWGDKEPNLSPLRQRITINQDSKVQIIDIETNMLVYTQDSKYYKAKNHQKQIDLSIEDFTTSNWEEETNIEKINNNIRYKLEKETQVVSIVVDDIVKTLDNTYFKALIDQANIDISIEDFNDNTKWAGIDKGNVTGTNYTVKKVSLIKNVEIGNYVRDYDSKFYKSKISENIDLANEDLNDNTRWEDFNTTSTSYIDIPAWKDNYGARFYPKHYREIYGGYDATGTLREHSSRRILSGINRWAPASPKQRNQVIGSSSTGKYFRIGHMGYQYSNYAGIMQVKMIKNGYVANMVLQPYCAAYGDGDNYMGNIPRALYKKWGSSSSSLKAYIDINSGYIYAIVQDDGNKVSTLADNDLVSCSVFNMSESFNVQTMSEEYMASIRGNLREFVDIIAEV